MNERLDDAALVAALDRTRALLDELAATLESAGRSAARGQSQLEAVGDAARGPSRRDVRTSLQPLYEALERAKLGALNAGLEAARIGDPLSKVVMQLASDSRELVLRALEALEAHVTLLAESERDQERWLDGVAQARSALGTLGAELATLQRQQREAQASVAGLEQALGPVLGTDPTTARLLVALRDQAGSLARTIGELSARGGADTAARLRSVLGPVMEALAAPGKEPE